MGKLLILGALAVAASASAAQANTLSPAKAAAELGKCIVKADRGAAVSLLKALPLSGNQVDWSAASLGAAGKCRTAATETVSMSALRGGVAQELYKRDFADFGMQPQRAVYDLASFKLPVDLLKTRYTQSSTRSLAMTTCVCRWSLGMSSSTRDRSLRMSMSSCSISHPSSS